MILTLPRPLRTEISLLSEHAYQLYATLKLKRPISLKLIEKRVEEIGHDLEHLEKVATEETVGWLDEEGQLWRWDDVITLGPNAEDYR